MSYVKILKAKIREQEEKIKRLEYENSTLKTQLSQVLADRNFEKQFELQQKHLQGIIGSMVPPIRL